ncbi:MAG: AraC family transcriptional regulator [Pseudomonadota bacterium]
MFAAEQLTEPRRRWRSPALKPVAAIIAGLLMLVPGLVSAEDLGADIDRLKADVAALASELYTLEETILHPADTQVAVFLTLAGKNALELDSVELFLDDTPVSSHLYTDLERQSLQQGGVQQVYLGNLPLGDHHLKAVLTARTQNDRYVRREASHRFRKEPGESRIQMSLDAQAPDFEPRVAFREWK